ncbi:hypothetical protein [Lentilactobacillus sp. SPB1-3]|uniref:Uncharacterized protein n=1 Tax=Lentilactobacillus terminaliae TaxID=3003483 RepID=A0ACD5DGB3_9LACO|nr:hypothetical protein [Lentilactobacillus sp. SPB1-3]MCZ0976903.1 hypothetical protein [Lentilactobacillus sp. SPB1-3]
MKKFVKRLLMGLFIVIAFILILSISPKLSVRTTMAFSGHPVKAIMCDPKHIVSDDAFGEKYYAITDRYWYRG